MADSANTRSRKKRSRNHRRKTKQNKEIKVTENSLNDEISVDSGYSVDFPEKSNNAKLKVKSRSLDDDDDSVKIQEVTESCGEDKQECEAIISEADSDWEETTKLRIPRKPIPLSTVAISIDEEPLQRIESLSPEEELSLRNFLESINLVDAPEISSTISTLDTIKKERARKREALEKYFTPLVHNPRYLDIISEEGSDLSDREAPSLTQHLKQGTPELDYTPKVSDKASPRLLRKNRLKRLRLPRCENRAVLVCTKILETPSIIETVHAHADTEENIAAETVFIDTSSGSNSSDSDNDPKTEIIVEPSNNVQISNDDILHQVEDISSSNCAENSADLESYNEVTYKYFGRNDDQGTEFAKTSKYSNIEEQSSSPTLEPIEKSSGQPATLQTHLTELTPPPTPTSSPKNKLSINSSVDLEECMQEIACDAAKEITSVLSRLTQSCHSTSMINYALTSLLEKSQSNYLHQPSRSTSRSSSSSRETSPSTVRLNPMNSSFADVTSILPDLELAKEALTYKQPISLRQKCLNVLLSLPCGAEILQELSDVAVNLDKLTQAVKLTRLDNEPLTASGDIKTNNIETISDSTNRMWSKEWAGLRINNEPNVFLCLSPTQNEHIANSEGLMENPEVLLDLHNKFKDRENSGNMRSYSTHNITISSISEEDMERKSTFHSEASSSRTLPKNFKHMPNKPRLEASNLGDWLKIARNDSNCSQDSNPETNHVKEQANQRRASLPNDVYQRQMQYILEKEKEIEHELEQLLEEKRKLFLEMRESADEIPKVTSPPTQTETFRQKMYEEYMKQVAEREDRKQHKVIKITSCPASKTKDGESPKLEATHVSGIEDEFMKRVQELHGPLQRVDEEVEQEETQEGTSEPILLMDGNSLKEATDLPKHLKEFVEITSDSSRFSTSSIDSSNGESE